MFPLRHSTPRPKRLSSRGSVARSFAPIDMPSTFTKAPYTATLTFASVLLAGVSLFAQEAPRARIAEEQPGVPKAKPVEGAPTEEVRRPPAVPSSAPGTGQTRPETKPAGKSDEDYLFELAKEFYLRKNDEAGVLQFEKYIQAYPRGRHLDAAYTLKGECHLRLKQLDNAVACYREVVKRFKSGTYLAYSASRLGTLLFNDNKHLESAPYFDTAGDNAGKPDERSQYYYYEGLAFKYAQKSKDSAEAFEKAARVAGGTPGNIFRQRAMLESARYLSSVGKKTLAFDNFEKLMKDSADPAIKAESAVSCGMILLDTNKNTEAIEFFNQSPKAATQQDAAPWIALAKFGLIRANYALEQWKKVTDAWQNLDIKQISESSRSELILMVGNAFRSQENYSRAIDLYGMIEQFFADTKEASEASYRRLVCLYKLKDPRTDAAAEAFIDRQKQRDEASEYIDMAALMKAEDNFAKKKWEQAAKSYRAIRQEKIPEDLRASMLYRKGWAEAQSGNHGAAVDSLSAFVSQNPKDPLVPVAILTRANSFTLLKDLTNAIKDYDAIVETYPNAKECEDAFRAGSLLRGQNKDFEGMVGRLEALLKKFPETKYKGECKFWIGTGFYMLKKYKEAVPVLQEARELYREQWEDISMKIIICHTSLDETDALAKEIDTFYAANPKTHVSAEILGYLGQKRHVERDYAAAARYLGLAVKAPDASKLKPVVWFQLAEAQMMSGENAAAVASVDKFLATPGDLPAERKAKSHYIRGSANLALKKLDEAYKDAENGLSLHTQDINESRLMFLRGGVEEARGNLEEAAQNLVIIVTVVRDNELTPEAFRRIIRIYRKLGKSDLVDKFMGEFKSTYPKEAASFSSETASFAEKAP